LASLLRTELLGVMAGCRGLAEVEELSAHCSVGVRRALGLKGRIPDTSQRDVLCRIEPDDLRSCLHRATHAAHRRKALKCEELPFHAVAMDGKGTSLPCWDDRYAQRHHPEEGLPYGIVRTVTAALVTAPGRPCIDANPIPVETNEMGHFQTAFQQLVEVYGDLFRVVTYDAGASSEANGRVVVDAGKDYMFHLRNESRYMYRMAEELLDPDDVVAQTEDTLDNSTTVTRKLSRVAVERHWNYGRATEKERRLKRPEECIWKHTRTFLRIESVKEREGEIIEHDVRLYNSSLRHDALTPEQWMHLIRAHWGVENNNHHTFDVAFEEDDRPWITGDPRGMLNVLLLRRIAYTLLTLFRSVTQRSEDKRVIRWKALLRWVHSTLLAAHENDLEGLRPRKSLLALG
jgi:predicted transposase YbfD/YdcC